MRTVSGIGRAARSLAVYASQPPSPTSTQHSLPGCWLSLPGRDLHPLGSYLKFPLSITRLDSFHLSQACLAHLVPWVRNALENRPRCDQSWTWARQEDRKRHWSSPIRSVTSWSALRGEAA